MRAHQISHLTGGDSGNAVDQRTDIGELQVQFRLFESRLVGLDRRFGG